MIKYIRMAIVVLHIGMLIMLLGFVIFVQSKITPLLPQMKSSNMTGLVALVWLVTAGGIAVSLLQLKRVMNEYSTIALYLTLVGYCLGFVLVFVRVRGYIWLLSQR